MSITYDRITAYLVDIIHCDGELLAGPHTNPCREMGCQPVGVFFAGVFVAVTPAELACQLLGEAGEPGIITAGGAGPLGAGVPGMTGSIMTAVEARGGFCHGGWDGEGTLEAGEGDGAATAAEVRVGKTPVGRVEKLDGFEEHFHNVFVAVPAGGLALPPVEGEDVHFGGMADGMPGRKWVSCRPNFSCCRNKI